MKKIIFAAFALTIAAGANAAWNQQCFYGKCCVNGVINEECAKPDPIVALCHKRCVAAKGPKGNAFVACKKDCISKRGKVEEKKVVVAQKPQPKPQPQVQAQPQAQPKAQPAPAVVAPAPVERLAVGKTVRIDGEKYSFPHASAAVSPEFSKYLQEKAGELKGVKYNTIVITGYTDSTGSLNTNNRLSEERAKAVASEFQKAGIPASKIEASGKGPLHPIADNSTPVGRRANRRVEVTVK